MNAPASSPNGLAVLVVVGDPASPRVVPLTLAAGATIADAIAASGLVPTLPSQSLEYCRTAVFGKLRPLETLLHDGDRVEITLPLRADPKRSRAERAERARREDRRAGRRWRPGT